MLTSSLLEFLVARREALRLLYTGTVGYAALVAGTVAFATATASINPTPGMRESGELLRTAILWGLGAAIMWGGLYASWCPAPKVMKLLIALSLIPAVIFYYDQVQFFAQHSGAED